MMAEYKKGDWVRAKDAYVAEHWNMYWSSDAGVTADRDTVFKVYDAFAADDTIAIGVGKAERGPTWSSSRFEPWQPKVGERVRVAKHVNSYGDEIRMDLPIGSVHTVTRVGDALSNKDRPSFTLSGSDVHFYLVENLEPVTDTLPVAEQPAALTIQAGRYYQTRDGRKVGPMRASKRTDWPFIGNAEGESGAWYKADGTCPYIPNDDLIAEWVDTPAAPVRDITAATVDAINDEYGPVVLEVAVAERAARFKVGDLVVATRTYADITAGTEYEVVEVDEHDDGMPVRVVDNVGDRYWLYDDAFRVVAPAVSAIVCKIDNGQPLPASRPHVHTSTEAADAEARRLAGSLKGQEFGVFVLTGATHKEAKVYEHEWQRLAAAGDLDGAATELHKLTGMPHSIGRYVADKFAA